MQAVPAITTDQTTSAGAPREAVRGKGEANFATTLEKRRKQLVTELQDSTQTDVSRIAAQELQSAAPQQPPPAEPEASPQAEKAARKTETTVPRRDEAKPMARQEPVATANPAQTSQAASQITHTTRASGNTRAVAAEARAPAVAATTAAQRNAVPAAPVAAVTARAAAPVIAARPTPIAQAVAGGGKGIAAREALARLSSKPEGPRLVADETVVGQLSRGLEAALRQGGGRVSLRLNPEHLGPVAVKLKVDGGSVEATLEPRTEAARQLLADSIDTLRAALEARGLSVERIEIDGSRIDPSYVPPNAGSASADGGGQGARQWTGEGASRRGFVTDDAGSAITSPGNTPVVHAVGGTLRLDAVA